jgi:MFS family permease
VRESEVVRPGVLKGHAGPHRVLVVLCLTQVTSWGVLFYGFPVLAPTIAADRGWSGAAVTGAFSVALLVSAVVGVPVGRLLDRHGPRVVMTVGSVLAVAALGVVASAWSLPWFYAGWVLVGVAMAGVLYQPAFAALTRWHGAERRVAALTVVTLAGGLASTVFAPLTDALAGHFSWRETYLVLAALLAVLTVPAHLFGLRLPWPAHPAATDGRRPTTIARSRPFVLLVVSMSVGAVAVYGIVVALVPPYPVRRSRSSPPRSWRASSGASSRSPRPPPSPTAGAPPTTDGSAASSTRR